MRLTYFLLIIFLGYSTSVFSQFKTIKIDNGEINYIDKGAGEPVIFVHGALEDYRTWDPQIDSFSKKYRVISYSRRFNYPNQNRNDVKDFSAQTEANDLANLIVQLKLQPVHLVGHSLGGLITLFLAKDNPELIRSLTLSEPAILSWLPDLDGGKQFYNDFYNNLMQSLKLDFKQTDTVAVLRRTIIFFYGEDLTEQLPDEVRTQLIDNLPEWHAISYSKNAFPPITKQEVQSLNMPVFLLSAGQTMPLLKLTNAELKRLLPNARSFHLPDGTHDYWITHPKQMRDALMSFLQSVSKN